MSQRLGKQFRENNPLGTLQVRMQVYKQDPSLENLHAFLKASEIACDQLAGIGLQLEKAKAVGFRNAVPAAGPTTVRARKNGLKLDEEPENKTKIGNILDPEHIKDVQVIESMHRY